MVLDANHDIRLARSAVDAARAGVSQADTAPNPTLSFNAVSYSPRDGLGNGNIFGKRVDQSARVDQTFERGDKRRLRVAVAQAQLDAKGLDLQEQRRQTLQSVRNAYVDLVLAEARTDVVEQTRQSYASALDAAGKRVRAGDLARADLARFRVELLRAETEGDAAVSDVRHAQNALVVLTGVDADPESIRSDGHWPSVMDSEQSDPTLDTLALRPDVASADRAVAAANTAVELARSQRVRDVTVGVQVERYPGIAGTGNTIGAGISVPLFIGNTYDGEISHAVADRESADIAASKVRAAAAADIRIALADRDTARRKLVTFRGGLVEAATSAAQSAEFAFNRGSLGLIDLLDARRTLQAIRLDALAAEADYARAAVALEAARTRIDEPRRTLR